MKTEVGFVAVGQAGGNLGRCLESRGYDVFYINTSTEDLELLKQAKHKHHLKGGEGCNKDRDKAKQIFAHNMDDVLKEIKEQIRQPMVFTLFSAGGGTGSGIGPVLTEMLGEEGKQAGAVTILPAEQESVKAHINAYACAKELADIEEIGAVYFLDNNRLEDILKINDLFAGFLHNFLSIPTVHKHEKGNIDRAEIKEMLSTKGASIISVLSKDNSTTTKVIESAKKNIFAPLETDRAIKYIAISAAGDIDLQELQKEVGTVLDVYRTYNEQLTICCLAGLNYPFTRLIAIRDKVKANQEAILSSLNAVNVNKLEDDLDIFRPAKKSEPKKSKSSSRDLLKKYL